MTAAIYARKSAEENDVAESKSVVRQLEHARAYVLKKGWWILVLAVLIVPLDVAGQRYVSGRETLRGLQGVAVVVETLSDEAERDGLTQTAIQTDVELKLRMAGIPVHSSSTGVLGYLYINVNTVKGDGLYAVSIDVALRQEVSSLVRPGVRFDATTWDRGSVRTVRAANLRAVRDSVKDFVDRFINDYLAVNPKKGG